MKTKILIFTLIIANLFCGVSFADDLIEKTAEKFMTLSYSEQGMTMQCNLFLPEGYPKPNTKYPLVAFIADGTTVGKDAKAPLTQGYGGTIWAFEDEQKRHECIVLVPQYPQIILDNVNYKVNDYLFMTERLIQAVVESYRVDPDRVYAAGQSMGCMAFMIMAVRNPELFAAELFVAGQWDINKIKGLTKQKFFNVVSEGDLKSYKGQLELMSLFKLNKVPFSHSTGWNAKMNEAEVIRAMNTILSGAPAANFINFKQGTVLPDGTKASALSEHLYTFDAAFKMQPLRDWLFRQRRNDKVR